MPPLTEREQQRSKELATKWGDNGYDALTEAEAAELRRLDAQEIFDETGNDQPLIDAITDGLFDEELGIRPEDKLD